MLGSAMTNLLHKELTDGILRTFYDVYNRLGYGFMEHVYENALAYELRKRGYAVTQQQPITVWYDSVPVGKFFADLVVDGLVVIELKSAERLVAAHEAQLYNYLKATHIEVGLLLNFGPEPQIRRKIFENARKHSPARIKQANPQ
jgi:GxxExxY protein